MNSPSEVADREVVGEGGSNWPTFLALVKERFCTFCPYFVACSWRLFEEGAISLGSIAGLFITKLQIIQRILEL